jgi:hypothetical protein
VLFVRTESAARKLEPRERREVMRALLHCRVAEERVCRRAVESAIFEPRRPSLAEIRGARSLLAHIALARADGIALGRRVFVRGEHFGPDGSLPIDLVAHEVTHVAQYLRDGALTFYLRYARAYGEGRANGLDDHHAYLAIPYEVEARAVAKSALRG